jgi:hypothetical protein
MVGDVGGLGVSGAVKLTTSARKEGDVCQDDDDNDARCSRSTHHL